MNSTNTAFRFTIFTAIVVGIIYRFFPVFTGDPDLSQFFITEDGYLMLTVARNMAIGLGMSVSEGNIPTNGVQPLATFIYTIPYLLTGGAKLSSLAGIVIISGLISIAGLFVIQRFARVALRAFSEDEAWSWLVATLWFVGPLLLLHTMNALETGLYTVFVIIVLLMFNALLKEGEASTWLQRFAFGAVCGLAFLSRIDAVFLLISVFSAWAIYELFVLRIGFFTAAGRIIPPGLFSIVVSSPWLINNYLGFGSIMPISGQSQSLGADLGNNLSLLPSKLFEHALPMFPIPESLEKGPIVLLICSAFAIAILAYFIVRVASIKTQTRYVLFAYVGFVAFMSVYYGLFFGAPHFMSRYMAPLSPLLILAFLICAIDLCRYLMGRSFHTILQYAGIASVVLCLVLLGRMLVPGVKEQGHFQVVHWIDENVPEETWVGAVQTGTIGYWHDRTINLDGKVNPEALQELQEKGNVFDYVVRSDIQYLADWAGLSHWKDVAQEIDSPLYDAFDIVLEDHEKNVTVFKRIN